MNYKEIDIEAAWTLFCCGANVERKEDEAFDYEDALGWWKPVSEMYGGEPSDGKERFMDCYSYPHWQFRVQVE